ncbi:HNH endonuclease [Halorientalis salina]|uniref:HNH endonuclease n=1 Tax=Halorientalis salina TaxID=2932266 RepID=UPI0010AC0C51|nr:HNH endonuclease [Halorientalis salina]
MAEHECPTCGWVFDTREVLRTHRNSIHAAQLSNGECKKCEREFYSDHQNTYCSEECREAATSCAGKQNPNYRGGKTATECDICDVEFEYYPSEKAGLYCPDCVENGQWRDPPVLEGENHPCWNGGKTELDCAICGEAISRYPSNVTGEVTLCSDDCRSEWLSEAFTGEGHPNWEGGGNGAYGKGWAETRRRALERDDYECQICGKAKAEVGRNPDVHHIVPVRLFAEADGFRKTDAHFLENVVSLCVECHRRADFGLIPKARLLACVPAGVRFGPHSGGLPCPVVVGGGVRRGTFS